MHRRMGIEVKIKAILEYYLLIGRSVRWSVGRSVGRMAELINSKAKSDLEILICSRLFDVFPAVHHFFPPYLPLSRRESWQ